MIKGFALRTIAWLMILLIVWYWVALWLTPTLSTIAGAVMHAIFPEWINGSGWNNRVAILLTNLPLRTVGVISAQRFEAVASITQIGIGLPLYIALLLASRSARLFRKILVGSAILFLFMVLAIAITWLIQMLTTRGHYSAIELDFTPWQVSILVLVDQLLNTASLLIPILIWLFFERRFAEAIFLRKDNVES
jgi:hypothetical protein